MLLGLILLGQALIPFARGAGFQPAALGQLWYALDPGSLNLLQAVTQRYLWSALWDNGVVWLLLQPAFVVALVLGGLLWLLTRPRPRRYYRGLR
jgi:ABC-type polysaccharide/polyol phosphate export permease